MRIAELSGVGMAFFTRLRDIGDKGAQINFKAPLENHFRFASVISGEKQAGDQKDNKTRCGRCQKQPRGD